MTTLEQLKQDLETAETMAQHWSDRVDKTIQRYGQGVRPSWVSAEIALDSVHRDEYLAEAATLRRRIERMEAAE